MVTGVFPPPLPVLAFIFFALKGFISAFHLLIYIIFLVDFYRIFAKSRSSRSFSLESFFIQETKDPSTTTSMHSVRLIPTSFALLLFSY